MKWTLMRSSTLILLTGFGLAGCQSLNQYTQQLPAQLGGSSNQTLYSPSTEAQLSQIDALKNRCQKATNAATCASQVNQTLSHTWFYVKDEMRDTLNLAQKFSLASADKTSAPELLQLTLMNVNKTVALNFSLVNSQNTHRCQSNCEISYRFEHQPNVTKISVQKSSEGDFSTVDSAASKAFVQELKKARSLIVELPENQQYKRKQFRFDVSGFDNQFAQ